MGSSNTYEKQPLNIKYHLYEYTRIDSTRLLKSVEEVELDNSIELYKCNTEEELDNVSKEQEEDMEKSYIARIVISLAIIVLALVCLIGCSTTYVDTDTSTYQAKAVSAVLSECVSQQMGIVGDTNLSLVRAYIQSTEGLIVCQEISQGVIDGLNK